MAKRRLLVFISYNIKDKDIATNVAIFLAAENLATWYDEWKISAGDSIIDEIENGLKGCSHFLIVWSRNSNKSKWVRSELKSALTRAIKTGKPRIIPVVLDESPLPTLLQDLHYLKYKGGTEHDRQQLIESITGKKPTMNFIRSIVRKYKEVVYNSNPNNKDPLGHINVCPDCGSDDLKRSMITDYAGDEEYFILRCDGCGWSTWTQ